MATRLTLLADLENRLKDPTNTVWPEADLKNFIDKAIEGLYPSFFQYKVATAVAGAGPLQTLPSGARNLYMVGLQRATSTRVRPVRGWTEGQAQVFVPKTGVTGETIVFAWTSGWTAPATDGEVLTLPTEAHEVVLLRCHISALEQLLTDRMGLERYHALQVRQAITEDDILSSLDALHTSLRERLETTLPLPEIRQ